MATIIECMTTTTVLGIIFVLEIQELLHWKSRRHGTKLTDLFLSRAFQRHQEHNVKHPDLVDFITTKQNKLPSFIDRRLHEEIINTLC
jgi:hypothetical protein